MRLRVFVILFFTCLFEAIAEVSLIAVGDIMPATLTQKGYLPDSKLLFVDAKQEFEKVDFVLGNLETTLADTGVPRQPDREYIFLTPIRYVQSLKDAGFDFLSLANNHTFDFGKEGLQSTMSVLEANGIAYSGIKWQEPYVVLHNEQGKKIAVCAFGFNFYCNQLNKPQEVVRIVQLAKSAADIVVVTFHGGGEGKEYRNLPVGGEKYLGEDRGSLREFAHLCIDTGADFVFGHGPHVVRAIELYKGRLIAYSLGNFCTPYGVSIQGISGYAPMLKVVLADDGHLLEGRIISMVQKRGYGPRYDQTGIVIDEIRHLSDDNIAGTLNITSTGHIVASEYATDANTEEIEEKYDSTEIDWSNKGW